MLDSEKNKKEKLKKISRHRSRQQPRFATIGTNFGIAHNGKTKGKKTIQQNPSAHNNA